MNRDAAIQKVRRVMLKDQRVLFAYLYGSFKHTRRYRDLDIAVYISKKEDPFVFAYDIKMDLHKETGLLPDLFDVCILNDMLDKGDLTALLVLRDILGQGILLVDKDFERRCSFIEDYNLKYRENEGLLDEVLL